MRAIYHAVFIQSLQIRLGQWMELWGCHYVIFPISLLLRLWENQLLCSNICCPNTMFVISQSEIQDSYRQEKRNYGFFPVIFTVYSVSSHMPLKYVRVTQQRYFNLKFVRIVWKLLKWVKTRRLCSKKDCRCLFPSVFSPATSEIHSFLKLY